MKNEEMRHSKNIYKQKLNEMKFEALVNELNRLNRDIQKCKILISSSSNPHQEHYNPKLLRWQKIQVQQKLFKGVKL